MAGKEDDAFAKLDEIERDRLNGLYSGLRQKLLDLTKRNRMLNYSLGTRSRRHLQVVDEVPEEIYRLLVAENASLDVRPIPEPDDIPHDEKTEEFISALEYAKNSDIEYLTALKALEATARDDDHSIMLTERKLRERVRTQLGMPPRPQRGEINRVEHAKRHGIDASFELPKKSAKNSHGSKTIQTIKFPDELEATLEKIADDARSAEQEMGLSTLFLSFGFLEWYDSDSSDKKYFAPLILLPVRLDSRKSQGKIAYSISATAEAAEGNLSLRRYLEQIFGRILPDFETDDEDSIGSIEAYLSQIETLISGLSRWRVCRWIVLGHFAFGRLAMYADLAPDNWDHHPVGHALVQSILRGTDRSDGNELPTIPDDYFVDDPEIEPIAPFLIHDADTSQHSALIDVVKGNSLVIQGPPGTGKSQTITNIIANALALGKSVLFLSEKQAALEVVKRRLDQAKLGSFCLQCHSDKSTSKQIVSGLKRRLDLGFKNENHQGSKAVDSTWLESRKEIWEYLNALHAVEPDGRTPFHLIWSALRGRSLYEGSIDQFKDVRLPERLSQSPDIIPAAIGHCEIFANAAQAFQEHHGRPSKSSWVKLEGIESVPRMESGGLIDVIEALRRDISSLLTTVRQNSDLINPNIDELRNVASAACSFKEPPSVELLDRITSLDLSQLELALQLNQSLRIILEELRHKPDLSKYSTELLRRACTVVENERGKEVLKLTPNQLADGLTRRVAEIEKLVSVIAGLLPILDTLELKSSICFGDLEAVATAITVVSSLDAEQRPWLRRFRNIDYESFELASGKWRKLVAEELRWKSRIGNPCKNWPPAKDIRVAAKILEKKHVVKLVAKALGFGVIAEGVIERLGFSPDARPTSQELSELASHVGAVDSFLTNIGTRSLVSEFWNGLETPFEEIASALKIRETLVDKLKHLSLGDAILERVLALSAEDLEFLSSYATAANSFRDLPSWVMDRLSDAKIETLLPVLERELTRSRQTLAIDPDRELAPINLSIQEISIIAELRTKKEELEHKLIQSPAASAAQSLGADDSQTLLTQNAIGWVRNVRASNLTVQLQTKLLGHDVSSVCGRLGQIVGELQPKIDMYDQNMEILEGRFKVRLSPSRSVDVLLTQIEELLVQRFQLSDLLALKAQRKILEDLGLSAFLDRADGIELTPRELPSMFAVLLDYRRAKDAQRKSAVLSQASGSMLEARRKAFSERDRKKIDSDRAKVKGALLPAKPLPGKSDGPRKTWTEMALIKNELEKEQRFAPIRSLFGRAHRSLQVLMPCFMMSPLSLAKFLPAEQVEFDILIIDEASQMRPEDALGGILRAKQIVVVGDPKQLPPTDFFSRADALGSGDDEDYEDLDDESILEACQKAFRQVRRLKWHYRSRCESLIAFSNREFYENSLITFPMARPGSFSIDLVRVEGVYQGRRNIPEALRIAEEAIGFMRHHAGFQEEGLPTLGIVAVNIEQRDLIREEVRRLSADDELVEEFRTKAEAKGEPLFIKNLENVQGDERDYMLISMTYGREPGATALKQRFGPINGKQGHRRLNVLFTRARQRIGLFTSFGSADITPTEKSHDGVRVLQRYLEYAEGLGRAPVENIGTEVDSDLEAEVADRLRARGYNVDYQVGVSGYRIDLGVRHPDTAGIFLAGIECDGARYHSSKSARDRDRIREEVLVGLGWHIVRVWSTDWFGNPEEETRKLVSKLEAFRASPHSYVKSADYNFAGATNRSQAATTTTEESEIQFSEGDAPSNALELPTEYASKFVIPDEDLEEYGVEPGVFPKDISGALREFRDTVIAKEMSGWEPQRSILREGMIETFVTMRLKDPDEWFTRVPQYQRQNTNPLEKRKYLDRICEIVSRLE
jgi:very-short-patch-repair endonuclease